MSYSTTRILVVILSFISYFSSAQVIQTPPVAINKIPAKTTHARKLGKTAALRDLAPVLPSKDNGKREYAKNFKPEEIPNFGFNTPMPRNNAENARPKGADPLRQKGEQKDNEWLVPAKVSVDGLGLNDASVYPPDANGAIGSQYYIQTINSSNGTIYKIWDKNGAVIYGPSTLNALWEEFGLTGFGDPVIMYDRQAQRWVITEFALPDQGNVLLIVVSDTDDPLGTWNAYEFETPNFPDYPKYGIWNNAYFVTTNEFVQDIPVYLLNRQQMLAGQDFVDIQSVGIPKFMTFGAFQVAAPVDWDGPTPPPSDAPMMVMRLYDDAWDGGADHLEMWNIQVDWNNPGNTQITGPDNITPSPFDLELCPEGSFFNCLGQPNGDSLDAMEDVLMNRVSYRNFGDHESIVLNHVVDANGCNVAGVRWYELRRSNGSDWSVYQEGTYSPDDDHRWLGSIAMDGAGNIGLAYTVMGKNTKPSLRFTGRRASDPLGQMTVKEFEFAKGKTFQGGINRWGDYAGMNVDPTDDRTFWFTGEYMRFNGWGTRVAAFRIDKDSIDILPIALLSPANSDNLGSAETVSVQVKNEGFQELNGFHLTLWLNGQSIQQNFTGILGPDSTTTVVFDTPLDLSAVQSYPLTIVSASPSDANRLNDTLKIAVAKLPSLDAGALKISGLNSTLCINTASPIFEVRNEGAQALNSLALQWQLDGNGWNTIPWSGLLAPGASILQNIPLTNLPDGHHHLDVLVNSPNGLTDQNQLNDTLSTDFQVITDGVQVQMLLTTDAFPQETSWELRDGAGNLLYSGGPYAEKQTQYIQSWCLDPDSCYVFTLNDSYGDGLQSYLGCEGAFQIKDATGHIFAALNQLNFGHSQDFPFCATFSCALGASYTTSRAGVAVPNDGTILLEPVGGVSPFKYSRNNGNSYGNNPLIQNLLPGIYHCKIKDINNCIASVDVEVLACSIDANYDVTVPTSGINNGKVIVSASDGKTPFKYTKNGGISYQANTDFTNLSPATYVFGVKDGDNCLRFDTLHLEDPSGVDNWNTGISIQLGPNPTEGIFNIHVKGLSGVETLAVEIWDANGRILQHNRLVRYDRELTGALSLLPYPDGVYFVRFRDPRIRQLCKVIKGE